MPVRRSPQRIRSTRILALAILFSLILGSFPPTSWPVGRAVPRAAAADQQMYWTWNVTGTMAADYTRGTTHYTSSRAISITGTALVRRDTNGQIFAQPFNLNVTDLSEGLESMSGYCRDNNGAIREKYKQAIIDSARYDGHPDQQYLVFPEHLEPVPDGNGGTIVYDLFPSLYANNELIREFTYRHDTERSSDCGSTTNFSDDAESARYSGIFTNTTHPLLPNGSGTVYTRRDTYTTEMQDVHGTFLPMTVAVFVTATPSGSADPAPSPTPSPSPSPSPGTPGGACVGTHALRVTTRGPGSVDPGSGTYPACTAVTLHATPAAGQLLTGWTVDGVAADRTRPLTLTMNTDHDVVATFAARSAFADLPANDPANEAITQLAARGIINGCDATATPPLFCPQDLTLRHQLAALIVRAIPGWAAETYTNTFTDPTEDAELWRRVATLQHYGVVGGYSAASCTAQGKTPPCYGPTDPVLKAQAISFVTRAMVAKGYWTQQPVDRALYGGALLGTGHEQDASTYWHYTRAQGGVPDYPEGGAFPIGEAAQRAWFARLLWAAIQGSPAAP